MNDADRFKLLHGPYKAPALHRGDRAFCPVRDAEVVITSWTDAPLSWPRCRGLDSRGRGSGLLVDEELARAIHSESSAAIVHWWGVSLWMVWAWRKHFGIGRFDTEGSQRLFKAGRQEAGAKQLGKAIPPAERVRRSERAKRLNLGRFLRAASPSLPPWKAEELAALGTVPDEVLAQRIGRTATAVRVMRNRMGIPSARDRRRHRCEG